jgi:HD-like signal output (HDOD) protein/CheY-like chemotaxis protein
MSKTILFVDQERYVHKALQRSFRKMRAQWDMHFADNPAEAISILAAVPVDVLITGTGFAEGQSGLDLLAEVREKHPRVVRIVMSGSTDRYVVLKSVNIAHQFLSKPCEDSTLQAAIVRAFMMKELLDQPAIKKVLSRIDSLPSLPALYVELVEELKSEEACLQKVSDIIAKDPALTAKLLKVVNSSFFGLPQSVSNPAKAVSLLGLDIVQAIVLSSGIFDRFKKLTIPEFSLERLWQHGMRVALFGKVIAQVAGLDRKSAESAFTAGLLHDIGKLLIATHLSGPFAEMVKYARARSVSMAEAEMAILGTTHAQVGAYLLGLWGLPDPIVEAAAFHHTPSLKAGVVFGPVVIIHVADAFAHAGDALADPQRIVEGIDLSPLQQLGRLQELQGWRQVCADQDGWGQA